MRKFEMFIIGVFCVMTVISFTHVFKELSSVRENVYKIVSKR